MNIYLLKLIGKWISLLVIMFISLFGNNTLKEENVDIINGNQNKNINVINKIIEYDTIYKYNSKIPINLKKILIKGEDGIVYQDENEKIIRVVKKMISEEVEVGTGPSGQFIGKMTGYGPDCKTCSGIGNVSCSIKNKKKFNLISDGVYYNDSEYDSVRVLAADLSKFPCGTIIKVNHPYFKSFLGIVLDTGGAMRAAWKKGYILFDLAFSTESNPDVRFATGSNIKYEVQRWGW